MLLLRFISTIRQCIDLDKFQEFKICFHVFSDLDIQNSELREGFLRLRIFL